MRPFIEIWKTDKMDGSFLFSKIFYIEKREFTAVMNGPHIFFTEVLYFDTPMLHKSQAQMQIKLLSICKFS